MQEFIISMKFIHSRFNVSIVPGVQVFSTVISSRPAENPRDTHSGNLQYFP